MRGQKVFWDVRVFNPVNKYHRTKNLTKVHDQNEKEKKVKHAARICPKVEFFLPFVFSCWKSGECSYFYKRLAEKL